MTGGGCEGGGVSPSPRWGHVCRWGLPGPPQTGGRGGSEGGQAHRTGLARHSAPDPDASAGPPRPPGLAAHRHCSWGRDRVSSDLWPLLTLTCSFPDPPWGIVPPDSQPNATRVSFLVVGGDPSPAPLGTGGEASLHGSVWLPSGGGQLAAPSWTQQARQADEGPWALCSLLTRRHQTGRPPQCTPLPSVGAPVEPPCWVLPAGPSCPLPISGVMTLGLGVTRIDSVSR